MKILILSNLDMGLYKFRKELMEYLVNDNEVFFCTPMGEFTNKIEELGCKFIACEYLDRRSTNPLKDLKLIKFYKKIVADIRPDVVLTYTIKPNVYGGLVCSRKKIPYIANITGLGTSIENGGLLSKITTMLYKKGLKNAKCVFFQNENNLKLFADRKIYVGKNRLIPGSGVNIEQFCVKSYPPDDKNIRFLFVGRIMKDKGIEELIHSIRKIHKENNNIVLDVVGFCDEDYLGLLKEAEEEGSIINHGTQSDVRPFYYKAHCTVLPSYHEGMANVLLESSSSGRPVIATRIPGCIETFDEGVTGFGCEVRNADSLYEAMKMFLNINHAQREKMGLDARKKMEKEFNRKTIVKAYCEEIDSI